MSKFFKPFLLLLGAITLAVITYDKSRSPEKNAIVQQYEKHKELANRYAGLSAEELKKLPKRDRPDLAFLQEFEETMDPALGYPPVKRKIEAYKIAQKILKNKANERAAISNVEWTERGPNNVGGRTRALMFDPNDSETKKVWAGAIGGGLWYNMDITSESTRWQPVNDMMSNLAISAIAYDPSNTQVFYMGTGLAYSSDIQGEGMWKSTDGGATWNQLTSTDNEDFEFVQKIKVTSSGTVLANTLTGIQRSIDGGSTWTNVLSGRMGDMEIASNGTIYSTEGINTDGAIHKSIDDGVSWTDITPADQTNQRRIEISSAPSDPNVLYAIADGTSGESDVAWMVKSVDGGDNWTNMVIPKETEQDCSIARSSHFTRGQAFFDLISLVNPQNPEDIIVGGIDIYRSTDAGSSWNLISYWTGGCDDYVHADQHEMVYRPGYPNEAIFGTDGGVFYSPNVFRKGSNPDFNTRNNGYNVTTFYSCATINEFNSNYFLAGSQDNGTQQLKSVGVGSAIEVTGGDGGFCFIDQDNPDIQISSFVFNSYRLSLDRGKSFNPISNDQSKGRFINPSEYDSDADILYGAASSNEMSRIADLTATTPTLEYISLELGNGQINNIKASPYTANRLFLGVGGNLGSIYMIDDANAATPTVTDLTGTFTGDSRGGTVSSIDVGASDDHLLVTFANYGVASVFETTDGGANWINKEDNLPDMPVRWGLYNPSNRDQVLLATEMGVWSTDNFTGANPNWEPTNSGLANVRCDMLKYRASDQTVVVATYGRGVYTTDVFASTIDANFETKQVVGYAGVPVEFTDASLLPNNSWSWDFGDGNTSTLQNPSNTYTAAGTYTVSLSIDNGASTETKTDYVTILPVKSTPYTPADGGDFESNPDDFTSKALVNDINHWERGTPGNRLTTVSSGTNAWKTDLDADIVDMGYDYSCALYTPAFDLSDDTRTYTVKFKKSMENGYSNAPHGMQFQFSVDGGKNWNTLGSEEPTYGAVNWFNRGPNRGTAFWQSVFSDYMGWSATNLTQSGTTSDNSVDDQNTEYILKSLAGQSNVSFRFVSAVTPGASNDQNGSVYDRDGFMIDDFEIAVAGPGADFDSNTRLAYVGRNIEFTYQSNGATSFAWDFGDGNTSDVQNPVHAYSSPGLFTVSLTITSVDGNVTETKNDYIHILPERPIPYLAADGGNFDVNQTDFGAANISGTAFELGNSTVTGKDGTASGDFAWVTGLTETLYQDNSEAHLMTPIFEFGSAGTYTLRFKAKHKFEDTWDGFIVEYSTNLGDDWTKLNNTVEDGWYTTTSNAQSVFGASVPMFSGNTNGEFVTYSTDVSFLFPNDNVIFRLLFLTDTNTVEEGMAIDDFELEGPAPGPAVPDFTYEGATGCDGQVVTFTNASTGTISSFAWDFGANASPATATGTGPHEVTYSGTSGTSTVSLTVESSVSGTQSETKADIISLAANHVPTFTSEFNGVDAVVLTASSGDSYQWYLDDTEITTDGTGQTYQATVEGSYHVDVTINGCVGSSNSEQITLNITSIEDDIFDRSISVFPNPTNGKVKILISNEHIGDIRVNVYNLLGSKLLNNNFVKKSQDSEIQFDLSQLSYGTYLMEVISEKGKTTKRVLIK